MSFVKSLLKLFGKGYTACVRARRINLQKTMGLPTAGILSLIVAGISWRTAYEATGPDGPLAALGMKQPF